LQQTNFNCILRALANVTAHLGTAAAAPAAAAAPVAEESMDVDAGAFPEEVIEKMDKTSAE
jgi:hypothetical protein